MTQSPQITARINAIAKELANGKDRGEIVSKFVKKWQTNSRTIDRYIKKAKPIATSLSNKANKAVEDAVLGELAKAAKNGLKPVIEIDMKLQEIIFKSHQLIRDSRKDSKGNNIPGNVIKVENTTADQLKAIDIFYRRHGHYEKDNIQSAMVIRVTRK